MRIGDDGMRRHRGAFWAPSYPSHLRPLRPPAVAHDNMSNKRRGRHMQADRKRASTGGVGAVGLTSLVDFGFEAAVHLDYMFLKPSMFCNNN